MDNKPKKSRAFIITFIIVLVLLFVGYMLLKNSGASDTKSSSFLNKIFAPLLGTSKNKDVKVIDNPSNQTGTDTTDQNPTGDGTSGGDLTTGISGVDGGIIGTDLSGGSLDGSGSSDSNLNPLPIPGSSRSTSGSSSTKIITTNNDRLVATTANNVTESLCPVDDPLSNYFTDADNVELQSLLKQFYLMAPTIRTEDSITVVKDEVSKDNAFIVQLDELINDCKEQKSSPSYTGPQAVKSNPYYPDSKILPPVGDGLDTVPESPTYLPNEKPLTVTHTRSTGPMGITMDTSASDPTAQSFSIFEKLLYIW